jgi:dihydrofolate reductase
MKIILVFVSSLDGRITRWNEPHVMSWTSKEDQEYFKKNWREHKLVVIGSGTYDAEPISAPKENRLVILTSHPENYKDKEVTGHLEFTNESPAELVKRLNGEGYSEMMLAGGPHVATSFLKEGLVDELWLTLEPKIFASGANFAVGDKLDINLHLFSTEKINEQGTLILKYQVSSNKVE